MSAIDRISGKTVQVDSKFGGFRTAAKPYVACLPMDREPAGYNPNSLTNAFAPYTLRSASMMPWLATCTERACSSVNT